MLRLALLVAGSLSATAAWAGSGAGLATEYVGGYTRADGTHVASHYRLRADATHAFYRDNDLVAALDPAAPAGGVPRVPGASGNGRRDERAPCVYKNVMTDSDLAACRAP